MMQYNTWVIQANARVYSILCIRTQFHERRIAHLAYLSTRSDGVGCSSPSSSGKQRRGWNGRNKFCQHGIVNGDTRGLQCAEENSDDWFKAAVHWPHIRRGCANFFSDCISQQQRGVAEDSPG